VILREIPHIACPDWYIFLQSDNITAPAEVYVRAVELSQDGNHARAACVIRRSDESMTITDPQWHNSDGDWWQIDD